MEVIELRYGKEDGYKVQFIDELPKNKIIIALHSKTNTAFLVTQANNYQCNKHLDIFPITQFEKTNRLEHTTEEELLQDSDFKIYALDNLGDLQKIKDAYFYN